MKMWKVYRRTDRQTDRQMTDDRWSEKLTWAFSSGSIKFVPTWQFLVYYIKKSHFLFLHQDQLPVPIWQVLMLNLCHSNDKVSKARNLENCIYNNTLYKQILKVFFQYLVEWNSAKVVIPCHWAVWCWDLLIHQKRCEHKPPMGKSLLREYTPVSGWPAE